MKKKDNKMKNQFEYLLHCSRWLEEHRTKKEEKK